MVRVVMVLVIGIAEQGWTAVHEADVVRVACFNNHNTLERVRLLLLLLPMLELSLCTQQTMTVLGLDGVAEAKISAGNLVVSPSPAPRPSSRDADWRKMARG
eukprot:CAMPEP_0115358322 /NCGR_PEP_ID=MMETSP0270-20121206/100599_1 /TAXON_ID=71861 /ORGANISM="Scrippsiella trochoidea, Strain CCMP3099" /LENGTH=101 /DNA_ID=CAMNT_0002780797 /DNA_START=366 /DNA_END=672 /DNA_ORIENTATION=+